MVVHREKYSICCRMMLKFLSCALARCFVAQSASIFFPVGTKWNVILSSLTLDELPNEEAQCDVLSPRRVCCVSCHRYYCSALLLVLSQQLIGTDVKSLI